MTLTIRQARALLREETAELNRPPLNVPLLRKMVDWVKEQSTLAEDDRDWNQEAWAFRHHLDQIKLDQDWIKLDQDWIKVLNAKRDVLDPMCGTSVCVAGKIALDAGWDFDFGDGDVSGRVAEWAKKGDEYQRIEHIAMRELGINDAQADYLFGSDNEAEDIEQIAEEFAEAAGERL